MTETPATTTTTTDRSFGVASKSSRSWSTEHGYLIGSASKFLRHRIHDAALLGAAYTHTADDEAHAMALDACDKAAERGEEMSYAAARRLADRKLGVKGSRGRTGDRLVQRANPRLTMGHPERVIAMREHDAGVITDDEWAAVRARFTGVYAMRKTPGADESIDIVLTPKGRELYNLPPAKPGDLIGFTKGNRYGGGKEIYQS